MLSVLLVLLATIFSECIAFTGCLLPQRPLLLNNMGGYYNENREDAVDQSQTHMLFGTRCRERRVEVAGMSLVTLNPVSQEGQEEESTSDIALAEHLLKNNLVSGKVILEIGASVVSLAAARQSAARVIACHEDETKLQILQQAHLFYNDPGNCSMECVTLQQDADLPAADIVVITDLNAKAWLQKALESESIRRVFTSTTYQSYLWNLGFGFSVDGPVLVIDLLEQKE